MLPWLIPLVLLVISVAILLTIGFKYRADLVVIDVNTDLARQQRGRKQDLIVRRLERVIGANRASKVSKLFQKLWQAIAGRVKSVYARAHMLERRYKRLQKQESQGVAASREVKKQLYTEAKEMMKRESYAGAEQRLIELISLDKKNVENYELLGNLYVKTRAWKQARETFEYANKLAPEDPSIVASLGELALRDGDVQGALVFFERAVDLRSNNPKYLDFLIETAILVGSRRHALKGIKLMKEVNPDNAKIEEFEKRAWELKK